jgi:D-alanyl-D-alanine carboxypeptidase/D-alanyl-D-alanine-endopeptidase (penicillin-binding protein 4)
MPEISSIYFSQHLFPFLNWRLGSSLLSILILIFIKAAPGDAADRFTQVKSLIGPSDSILVTDPENRPIVSKNRNTQLIPASILKVLTSLIALHYLGPNYRYKTEFYLDKHSNIKIKGFGDPLLISEIVNDVAAQVAGLLGNSTGFNDLIVDDSQFDQPLTIPGISSSSQPYDAPNGALCVNFNTVYFKQSKMGYVSAEAQTPLLPYAEKKIKAQNIKNGRFVLSHLGDENTIYAGKIFQHFLGKHGVDLNGAVKPGQVDQSSDRLIFRYVSRYRLAEIVSKLLEHSNNFITNQLLISVGMKVFGPPGNLEKGVAAARDYAVNILNLGDISIVEGSGISRRNRISADQMLRVLNEFEAYHRLMRRQGREFYKTGTLHGVSTRAGYIKKNNGGLHRYVIMINTPGKSTKPVMRRLLNILK